MIVFKPRDKKGIGVGPRGPGDGIEFKLNNLGKRKMAKAQLRKESAELLKMAYINLAMAEITPHYPPPRLRRNKKGVKEWWQYTADWKTGTKAFLSAVKKGEPEAVKKAANSITNACNGCHADFRDAN